MLIVTSVEFRSQAKLTASRFLRVKKLTQHVSTGSSYHDELAHSTSFLQVQDKLEKIAAVGRSTAQNTPRSSFDSRSVSPHTTRSASPFKTDAAAPASRDSRPRADDVYEILCNDMVLPLNMTLAAVRQFVWRSSGELTMYYRKKVTPAAAAATASASTTATTITTTSAGEDVVVVAQ